MNSLQKNIAVSTLTHAIADVVRKHGGHSSPYLRLRLNPQDFEWSSPEICYLDSRNCAAYTPRAKTDPSTAATIVSIARRLADSIPLFTKPSSAPAHLELKAEKMGDRWLVDIKVVTILSAPKRNVESDYRCRVRYASGYSARLAA